MRRQMSQKELSRLSGLLYTADQIRRELSDDDTREQLDIIGQNCLYLATNGQGQRAAKLAIEGCEVAKSHGGGIYTAWCRIEIYMTVDILVDCGWWIDEVRGAADANIAARAKNGCGLPRRQTQRRRVQCGQY